MESLSPLEFNVVELNECTSTQQVARDMIDMMTDEYLPENEDGDCDNDPQIEDLPEPDPECDPQATLDAECLESDVPALPDLEKERVIVISAETQTCGIGTNGRKWESPKGNLYMTMGIPVSMIPERVHLLLPLEIGNALMKVFEAVLTETTDVALKWPNDILIGAEKVCGCLIEQHKEYKLVGIGINIFTPPQLQEGNRRPGAIGRLLIEGMDKDTLCAVIAKTVMHRLEMYKTLSDDEQANKIITDWSAKAATKVDLIIRETGEHVHFKCLDSYGGCTVINEKGEEKVLRSDYLW